MAFTRLDQYVGQKPNNPYPGDSIDPKLKQDKDYFLAFCRAFICDWVSGSCEIPYVFGENIRSYRELHEYATGTQSSGKIKDQLLGKHKKKDGKYITKMNISWDGLRVLPKMLDIMQEKNMRQDYDVDAICVDDDSIKAKEEDMATLKYLVAADVKDFMRITKFRPNTPIDPQAIGIETEADVDLYFQCGAYILQREIASIAACNKTKKISNYKVIQDSVFRDLIKYGKAGWKYEIDKENGEVKMRHVQIFSPELNATTALVPYSDTNNFDNLSKAGEVRLMTIKNLREECPNLKAAQLLYIAKCYSYMNPEYASLIASGGFYNTSYRTDMLGSYELDPLNRCKILVLDCQWLSVDIENYLKSEDRTLFKEVDYNFSQNSSSKRKGEKHIQKKVVKKFGCKWVIGTDILLEYGPCEDIVYYGPDGNKCPSLDYFFAKTGNMPLIERCIAIVDDIDMANTKLRNALASAIPSPRMVVQTGLLDNVFLNNIKQQPEDNMATFRELGYLMVNAVDDDGKPIFTNQKLVDFLPMGIQEDINVFTGQILSGINNLREVLGIPQGVDASTPNPYNGARKTELSMQSSNAALFPTFNSFQYLFEAGFNHCVKLWQIIAKDRDIKLNYSPLGEKNLKVLSLDSEFTNADFNIYLTLGSTEEDLKQLMTDITQMKQIGIQTNFQQGITMSEYLYLYERIKSGNAKEAMWVMAKLEAKKMAKQEQINQANQQQNAQDQQNSAAQAEINKQGTAKITGQQNRLTMILQEAEKRKTAAAVALINAYDKEGGPAAQSSYQKIIDEANAEVIGVLNQDQAAQSPQEQSGQPWAEQMQPPQQQVA